MSAARPALDPVEEDVELYSGLYKDAHGVKPRWQLADFRKLPAAERRARIDDCAQFIAEERYRQKGVRVIELIEALRKLPPDARVVVPGTEAVDSNPTFLTRMPRYHATLHVAGRERMGTAQHVVSI